MTQYRARRHIPRILAGVCSERHLSFLRTVQKSALPNPHTLFCIIATTLLVLVSLSSPIFDTVFFLGLSFDGNRTDSIERYGLWGYTKNTRHHLKIGYTFPGFVADDTFYNHLTKTFVLHPVAAVFSGLAVLTANSNNRFGAHTTNFATIASLTTLVAWILDMVVFTLMRNLYRNRNIIAEYGNGLWLTLGAFLALLLGVCIGPDWRSTRHERLYDRREQDADQETKIRGM